MKNLWRGGSFGVKAWTPHEYQKSAVKFLLEHACGALFLDPGLGKTSITLAAIKMLKEMKVVKKVLVIAPLRVVHAVWPVEVQEWKDFHNLTIQVLHGKDKDKALATPADIYVINPEGLDWLLDVTKSKTKQGKIKITVNEKRFSNMGFDTLVVDELSKFKRSNTGRFKAIKQVLGTFKRRWGLTGSPMANGYLDLFGQIYMLDEGNALGSYITHYRGEFFEQADYQGYTWELQKGAAKRIHKAIEPLTLRMAAEDYLDMPEVIENNIYVDVDKKVFKFYRSVEDDLIARLDDKTVVAANAAVASSKCRQIANGTVYITPEIEELIKPGDRKKETLQVHKEKINALIDLVDELQGAPLLVAYEFQHDLQAIQKGLGVSMPYIGGGVSVKASKEIIRRWNAGEIPVLLAHPQAAGHGLNLQASGCQHVCWFSPTWNYELYDQFNRRVLRQGNKNSHIFVHHILSRGTIDVVVMGALKSKGNRQAVLFKALQKLKAERLVGGG